MRLSEKGNIILAIVTLLLIIPCFVWTQSNIIDLEFGEPPVSDSHASRTLQSMAKVQGTGQFCQDGLYLMTHYGDREEIFQEENQEMIDNPLINQTWRHCSVFSATSGNSVIMGRNWDNQNVGSIIISLYHPSKGCSSISFSRSIDMGFGHKDLEQQRSSAFGDRLLLAPFYAMDGINEHGLAVAVAADEATAIKAKPDKELVYITFLIRKLLDQAKNIEDAVNLVEKFIPFDIDKNSLNSHLFLVDSSGSSVVLEYAQDQWRTSYGDKPWQVMSTKRIHNMSDADLRGTCWRYKGMSEALESAGGNVDWKAGMRILRDVAQKGTTWSAVYSPTAKGLYVSVYQEWESIYRLEMP